MAASLSNRWFPLGRTVCFLCLTIALTFGGDGTSVNMLLAEDSPAAPSEATEPAADNKQDQTRQSAGQPAEQTAPPAESSQQTLTLSLTDYLTKVVRNHPDLTVDEVAGETDPQGRHVLLVNWAKPPEGRPDSPLARETVLREHVNTILYEATGAYWTLTTSVHRKQIREQMLAEATTRAKQANQFVKAGCAREVCALFADAVVQARQSQLSFAKQMVETAQDRLRVLMNDPEAGILSRIDIVPEAIPLPGGGPTDVKESLLLAQQYRLGVPERPLSNADRKRSEQVAFEVADACRQIRGAGERMATESKCTKDLQACLEQLRTWELVAGEYGFEHFSAVGLVEEHLAAARLRSLDAVAAYCLGYCALHRAEGTLLERCAVQIKLRQ